MDIKKFSEFDNGYVIGNFPNSLIKLKNVGVQFKELEKDYIEEINCQCGIINLIILKGQLRVDKGTFKKDDVIIIKNEKVILRTLTNVLLLYVIKRKDDE